MEQIIKIKNYSDPTELKKVISNLQNRRKTVLREIGYIPISFNNTKFNVTSILPILESLYSCPLPENMDETDNSYYVYFHCNPLEPLNVKNNLKHLFLAITFPELRHVPIYVGKGKDKRAYDLLRNDSHRKIRSQVLKFNKDLEVVIVHKNLTNSQSLNYESKLIDILGLSCLSSAGMLTNLDEGFEPSNRRNIHYKVLNNYEQVCKLIKKNNFKV